MRPAKSPVERGKAEMRFLALGDSYTIGEGVGPEARWPAQLAARLRERGVAVEKPEIVARTGWTTGELWAAMDAAGPRGPYDLVSLLIGVNDQYRGREVEEYRREFARLLERAIGLAGGEARRVVVLSVPDWAVTPFAVGRDTNQIAAEIDAFNAANAEETRKHGARYVDVTGTSRRALTEPRLLAGDGLHPSGSMYAEWVKDVLKAIADLL
jgi:lysophospholipase L1-like esterase